MEQTNCGFHPEKTRMRDNRVVLVGGGGVGGGGGGEVGGGEEGLGRTA